VKRRERYELKKQVGKCTVMEFQTIVIECASESLESAKAYMEEKGYMVMGQRHPCRKDLVGADLTKVIVTGERELAK
jgi:hypothetical protein